MNRPARVLRTALLFAAVTGGMAAAEHPDTRPPRQWNFDVYLDDREIGSHHFQLSDSAEGLRLQTHAEFSVEFLTITVYAYEHRNTEIWQGGCLRSIEASTDSNGKHHRVSGVERGGRLVVSTQAGVRHLDECVATFAYWDRRLLERQRLLNPQTGEYLPVKLESLGGGSVLLGSRNVAVQRYALTAEKMDIELAYDADTGEWLALDSQVEGGRVLRYRRNAQDLVAPAGTARAGGPLPLLE
jgi:hypothetical protein